MTGRPGLPSLAVTREKLLANGAGVRREWARGAGRRAPGGFPRSETMTKGWNWLVVVVVAIVAAATTGASAAEASARGVVEEAVQKTVTVLRDESLAKAE